MQYCENFSAYTNEFAEIGPFVLSVTVRDYKLWVRIYYWCNTAKMSVLVRMSLLKYVHDVSELFACVWSDFLFFLAYLLIVFFWMWDGDAFRLWTRSALKAWPTRASLMLNQNYSSILSLTKPITPCVLLTVVLVWPRLVSISCLVHIFFSLHVWLQA